MPGSSPPSSRTPARTARQLALGLRVGPLAAASSSMGPLAYRVGYRGGPGGTTPGGAPGGHQHDEKLIDYVAIGAVAALQVAELARPAAALLTRVSPILRGIRTLGEYGATLSRLQIAVLAALRTGAEQAAAFRADELCEQLNRAASDDVQTWTTAKVAGALEALRTVPLGDEKVEACAVHDAERWRAV